MAVEGACHGQSQRFWRGSGIPASQSITAFSIAACSHVQFGCLRLSRQPWGYVLRDMFLAMEPAVSACREGIQSQFAHRSIDQAKLSRDWSHHSGALPRRGCRWSDADSNRVTGIRLAKKSPPRRETPSVRKLSADIAHDCVGGSGASESRAYQTSQGT